MCDICRSVPCLAGCPNAPDPPAVYACDDCGEGIVPGDEYAEIDGRYYHLDCLENMSTRELLELVGVDTRTAEEDDGYDG